MLIERSGSREKERARRTATTGRQEGKGRKRDEGGDEKQGTTPR